MPWDGNQSAIKTFKRFFGAISQEKIASVRAGYQSISEAFEAGFTVNIDIESSDYAYVYKDGRTEVFLGLPYFDASSFGFNSKGGVFIHELGHELLGLKDFVYGVHGTERLAIDNPGQAIRNADNYEYFAEGF